MTKKFKLDPSVEQDDITISAYQERVQALLPKYRKSLHVAIPLEAEFDRIRKRLDDQDMKIEELNDANNQRMKMFIGKTLIELARVLAKRLKIE